VNASARRVDAVIFDWGGTLTPWHDIDLEAQWYAYAEIYDPVHARALAVRLCSAELARWGRQRDTGGAVSTGTLDALFQGEGIELDSARHLRALGAYLDFWAPHTRADPDAEATLRALRASGVLIGVLSNTLWPASHHREVFERDGLLELLDACAYSSEIAAAKPHADSFLVIAELLGVHPESCAFVGDRLWDDIHGSQSVGMRGIWIPHSNIPAEQQVDLDVTPDAVADGLLDVVRIVQEWNSPVSRTGS